MRTLVLRVPEYKTSPNEWVHCIYYDHTFYRKWRVSVEIDQSVEIVFMWGGVLEIGVVQDLLNGDYTWGRR